MCPLPVVSSASTTLPAGSRAREAVVVLERFTQAGKDMDRALHIVAERGHELNELVGKLHACGVKTPTFEQLDALGFAAMQTAISRSPWSRRYRAVAPSERRDFGPLFREWATVAESRLRSLLTDEAA
jgi:hypothetical protein